MRNPSWASLALLLIAPVAHADQYLVRGTFIDPGMLAPPDAVVKMSESTVFPSLAMLSEWVKEGKIVGGVAVGEKQGWFIVDAKSNAELDRMIQSLPFWGLLEWEVTPLHSFAARMGQEKEMIAKMKEQLKK